MIEIIITYLLILQTVHSNDLRGDSRELQLVNGVCPLNFLSFSLPQMPISTNISNNESIISYQTTIVNFTSNFEGNDFYVNNTYVDPSAIKTFDDGTIRKMNKISNQCNFLDRSDYENGLSDHYFEIDDSRTVLIGECNPADNRYKSCAHVDSTVTVTHDQYFSKSVVTSVILESCKLFMDLNIATPFYHTYLGPYSVTSKFKVTLNGVQPYIMSTSDIDQYEHSFYNISKDILNNYNPPVIITKVAVLNQKLNSGLNLDVETEVLAYYNASLSFKKTISDAIYNVSKETIFIMKLRNSGNNYFKGLMNVENNNVASPQSEMKNNMLDFDIGQNASFYIPEHFSFMDAAAATALHGIEDDRLKYSTSLAMSLAIIFIFFGIIAIGAMYGRYSKREKYATSTLETSLDRHHQRMQQPSVTSTISRGFIYNKFSKKWDLHKIRPWIESNINTTLFATKLKTVWQKVWLFRPWTK